MKHVYIIQAYFSNYNRIFELSYFSTLEKAREALKARKETYKQHPELGITNPEEDITIRVEILY